ncbi:crossover junction endonuclease EME1B-like isoform X1 [Olea europaea subsp. europaea]|uniref:Crossover junction endonuclease EME1B-like isoform X1 n=1 Tax=Olea europaea subsp. europaea TaxID=158383 RepID=A0A8S0S966_OLEEU|nr:crossover junction endonuclease EME1B-like isoform X1 [Olea europaea subsp. europaea]
MSQPIPVDVLSDSDSDDYRLPSLRNDAIDLTTPPLSVPHSKKKQKTENLSNSTVFIIDDDPTPFKPPPNSFAGPTFSSTPSSVTETPFSGASIVKCSKGKSLYSDQLVVAETPISDLSKLQFPIVNCNRGFSDSEIGCSLISNPKTSGIDGLICVESDDESDNVGRFEAWKNNETIFAAELVNESEFGSRLDASSFPLGSSIELCKKFSMENGDTMQMPENNFHQSSLEDDLSTAHRYHDGRTDILEPIQVLRQGRKSGDKPKKKTGAEDGTKKMKMSKEEKKQQKEQEKLLKAASKAEAVKMKKHQKEMQKWEKGKYAVKSILAKIDTKVVELGSIGGHLLTRFAEKGLSYRITSNPVERSIIWTMAIPEEMAQVSSEEIEISYVLIIYEAEDFCKLVLNESLMGHIQSIQHRYPHHTICYLTNSLLAYINKREQGQYKNPTNYSGWKRPPIEEVLSKFTTHFSKVHSRHCADEAELAEHVVGLTCSLASCQFRKKLTRLSVDANGSLIPKDCVDKNLIKKSTWLKALIAIPKVQPRFAIAIWKKYPTMKSLLSVYMDPNKSVHEKEFLLEDLTVEGFFGDDRRLGNICSKRVYRILMAQCGNIKTDDIESGADFFSHQSE